MNCYQALLLMMDNLKIVLRLQIIYYSYLQGITETY